MKANVYKIDCITNLHVGSGDINYNIVDNEVEKDPVTNFPTVHSSGIKGALREHFKNNISKEDINYVFGGKAEKSDDMKGGNYKFLDAYLLARPMRVSGSASFASIPVVTVASVNDYLAKLSVFGVNNYGIEKIDTPDFGNKSFLSTVNGISVEGDATGPLQENVKNQLLMLKDILGEDFAVAKSFEDYPLPVIARNQLDDGTSKNLWYEEVVPAGSIFYLFILTPDADMKLDMSEIIQIGGHASVGCGFTKFTKLN